jgi:hypothetical protein
MGVNKEGILSCFMDSNKLFHMSVPSPDNKKKIFGEYSAATDSISILMNKKDLKYEEADSKLFNTDNILLFVGSEHERGAHLKLTKLSSYYSMIVKGNIDSYIMFLSMIKSFNPKYKIYKDFLLKWLKKLMISETMNFINLQHWKPIQETIANSLFIAYRKSEDEPDNIDLLDSLIEINNDDAEIKSLTDLSMQLFDDFGIRKGWNLLLSIASVASSPRIDPMKQIRVVDTSNICITNQHAENQHNDNNSPNEILEQSPLERYRKIINLTINHPEGIKKLLDDKVPYSRLAGWIANDCGLNYANVTEMLNYIQNFHIDSYDNKSTHRYHKAIHRFQIRYLKAFIKISKLPTPTFLFIRDLVSGNIFVYQDDIVKKYPWLRRYLTSNILIDQLMNSLKEEKDRIICFNQKLNTCKIYSESGCKGCSFYNNFINTKKLFEFAINNISYQDLLDEAIQENIV